MAFAVGCSDRSAAARKGPSAEPARPQRLRVMSWNIYRGKLGIDGLAKVIRQESPDVVLLQEVLRPKFAPEKVDQAASLNGSLSGYHTYSLASLQSGNVHPYGDPAILSRLPMKDCQIVDANDGGRAYAIIATLDAMGPPIHFVSVHLNGTFKLDPRHVVESMAARHRQVSDLINRVGELEGVAIIGGDFNTPEWMPEYRQMGEAWNDLGVSNDPALLTMPAASPAMRIDYVFAKGGPVHSTGYRVVESVASDHRPVIVDVEFAEGNQKR